ncbi:DPP IV N-terminal domain-containing protein [bacterium]|nr:DPP IV N-terminal domain-containing protein [bacterium]
MRRFSLMAMFIVVLAIPLFAQNPHVAKANYDLAAKFSPARMKTLVFSTSVRSHWLKHSDRFWYSYETSEGKTFYIVDPARKIKLHIFDNVWMAAQLTRIVKDPYDHQHLPIDKIKFIDNDRAIQFKVTSSQDEEKKEEAVSDSTKTEEKDDDKKNGKKDKKKNGKDTPKKKVFHFKYTLATQKLVVLEDYKEPKKRPKWANIAPDSSHVLFSKHHNLFWMDIENYKKALEDEKDSTIVEHAITDDGIEYYGYGGGARGEDNVDKEKNKDKRKGAWGLWSPDSKKFSMQRSDTRDVKDFWVVHNTKSPRPTLESYKYHLPGEKEAPVVELLVFDLESGDKVKIKADAFKDQTLNTYRKPRLKKDGDDEHRPSIWLSDSSDELYFYRTSRDLKRIDVCKADVNTGEVTVLIEERMNTYLEVNNLGLVNNGRELIQWSERDGWAHFYLYDGQGKLKNQITSGAFHCEDIVNIDEKNRVLYFTANAKERNEDPYFLHLYRVNFDGSGLKLLNPGHFNYRVSMSDSHRYFVSNYSRVNTAPKADLRNHLGQKLMDLETADLGNLMAAGYRFPVPFKTKAADGITDIYGVMYKPFNFDSTLSYPILAYVYPGPQTEAVNKSFSSRMDRTDRMAQLGFIVVTLGNRGGHPGRSKWYHNYGYGNLRDYGLADKKAVIEQLANRHGFIDISRVGIYGHSGGGFMSTAAMLVYPDFFKCAVSAAGNHTNNIYNRWWSEKHHGVKEVMENDSTVKFIYKIETNPQIAKNLKGHLMLVSGDVDNNVHPANTIRMANALIKANKRFDFFLYPGQRHGFGNMREYSFWLKADYFSRHLLGDWSQGVDMLHMNRDIEMNGKNGR